MTCALCTLSDAISIGRCHYYFFMYIFYEMWFYVNSVKYMIFEEEQQKKEVENEIEND